MKILAACKIDDGPLYATDMQYLPDGLEIKTLPLPRDLSKEIVKKAAEEKYDLAIACCAGAKSKQLIDTKFTELPCPKLIWFLDSHVLLQEELRSAYFFDGIFVAHNQYVRFFQSEYPKKIVANLPCAVLKWPIEKMAVNAEKIWDLYMVCNSYGQNSSFRENVIKNIRNKLARLKIFIGTCPTKEYKENLGRAHVALNISLKNDFNVRNFEALCCGVPLLSNKTTDHALIPEIDKYTVYFDPNNLMDIENKYQKARSLDVSKAIVWVKKNHCIQARLLQMINVFFKTKYELKI